MQNLHYLSLQEKKNKHFIPYPEKGSVILILVVFYIQYISVAVLYTVE